jgi:hypothetical protein
MRTIMNIRTTIRPNTALERVAREMRPGGGCWFSLGLSGSLKHQAGYIPDWFRVSG